MDRELCEVEKTLIQIANALPSPCRPVVKHILNAGGKRLRPLLLVLFARMHGYGEEDVYPLAASMEMLHAATLLHDDILDNAESRRGQAAAHTIFGLTPTILAGDALLAAGNSIVAAYEIPALVRCYSEATTRTAAGEILEMDSLCNPDLSHGEYIEIALGKTASVIANACAMGAILANASEDEVEAAKRYGENIGLAFQIVDDALDFAPQCQTGKPRGGDLREGKMTPPIRLFRESLDDAAKVRFDDALVSRNFSDEYFAALLENIRVFTDPALKLAEELLAEAKEALARLPDGAENQILSQMADYVRTRYK